MKRLIACAVMMIFFIGAKESTISKVKHNAEPDVCQSLDSLDKSMHKLEAATDRLNKLNCNESN
jgi:hypothetical protein